MNFVRFLFLFFIATIGLHAQSVSDAHSAADQFAKTVSFTLNGSMSTDANGNKIFYYTVTIPPYQIINNTFCNGGYAVNGVAQTAPNQYNSGATLNVKVVVPPSSSSTIFQGLGFTHFDSYVGYDYGGGPAGGPAPTVSPYDPATQGPPLTTPPTSGAGGAGGTSGTGGAVGGGGTGGSGGSGGTSGSANGVGGTGGTGGAGGSGGVGGAGGAGGVGGAGGQGGVGGVTSVAGVESGIATTNSTLSSIKGGQDTANGLLGDLKTGQGTTNSLLGDIKTSLTNVVGGGTGSSYDGTNVVNAIGDLKAQFTARTGTGIGAGDPIVVNNGFGGESAYDGIKLTQEQNPTQAVDGAMDQLKSMNFHPQIQIPSQTDYTITLPFPVLNKSLLIDNSEYAPTISAMRNLIKFTLAIWFFIALLKRIKGWFADAS